MLSTLQSRESCCRLLGSGAAGAEAPGLPLAAGAVYPNAASNRRLPRAGGLYSAGVRAKAGFLLVVIAVYQRSGALRLAAVSWAGLRSRKRWKAPLTGSAGGRRYAANWPVRPLIITVCSCYWQWWRGGAGLSPRRGSRRNPGSCRGWRWG